MAATLLVLGGCGAQQLRVPAVINTAPNPFANEKRAAHCEVSPLQTDATGRMSVTMTVMAGDGGMCSLSVSKGGGGSFVSFGVTPAPEHGKAFLYNYDKRTYVEYTPAADYQGRDSFFVELIPAHAQPRRQLKVDVEVQAPARPAAPAAEVAGKPSLARRAGRPAGQTGRKTVHVVRHAVGQTTHAAASTARTTGEAATRTVNKTADRAVGGTAGKTGAAPAK